MKHWPQYQPDLAVGVLTLVPLILITSALGAGILRRNHELIADPMKARWKLSADRRMRYSLLVGRGMCLAAIVDIIFALIELTVHTNALDWPIFGCSVAVTLGLGVAMMGNIARALKHGEFPTTDASPPPTNISSKSSNIG